MHNDTKTTERTYTIDNLCDHVTGTRTMSAADVTRFLSGALIPLDSYNVIGSDGTVTSGLDWPVPQRDDFAAVREYMAQSSPADTTPDGFRRLLWPMPLPGDYLPPELPVERFERIVDIRYVAIDSEFGKVYGVVIDASPDADLLLVEFVHPGMDLIVSGSFGVDQLYPLGELRDVVTYVDNGKQRHGFVVCCDGDVAVLEHWQSGARWPVMVRVPMACVQPFDRLLAEE